MSISNEIIKVLNALAEKFGIAVDWTSQNVIPFLEQLCGKYVKYEIATSIVWLIFGITCIFVGKWGIKKTWEYYKRYKDCEFSYWDIAAIAAGVATGAAFLIGVIAIMCQLLDIVTCLTFPEKIILDELVLIYTNMKS